MNDYVEAIQQNADLIRAKLNETETNDMTAWIYEMGKNIHAGFASCDIPRPSAYVPQPYFCSCGIDDYKRDCYWYDEMQAMGAHIPMCGKKDSVECRNCKSYLTKSEANKIINKHFEVE